MTTKTRYRKTNKEAQIPKLKLTGQRNQCPSCGEHFNSNFAFAKHLVGTVATAERRCMTEAEMIDKGMSKNSKGFWVTASMSDNLISSIKCNSEDVEEAEETDEELED